MANLSTIFSLLDEIVAGTDTFVGLVMLAVIITITIGVGTLVTGIFAKIVGKMK